MMQVKQFLGKWGMHSFLLPVFFVIHNYIQYYGLVSAETSLKILAEIIFLVMLFLSGILAFTGNAGKSFQVTTMLTFIILFYGVIKDILSNTAGMPWLASYSVMPPLMIFLFSILCAVIWRKKSFFKVNLFQNILLLVFIFIDLVPVAFRQSFFFSNRNVLVMNNILLLKQIPAPVEKPDVYFLLFDCYPGTGFLRDYMHFDNSAVDTALTVKGFKVIRNPKSNYNRTAFSMVSELNFEYLKGINDETRLRSNHYNQALLTMRTAAVPGVFEHLGYKIYNLSIFDFAGQQPLYKANFLSQSEEHVLLYNTLIGRVRNDLSWNFISGKYSNVFFRKFADDAKQSEMVLDLKKRDFTKRIADSVIAIPAEKTKTPKFIYAHFFLPHPPFFYNEKGESNELDLVLKDTAYFSKKLFLGNLKYTNKVMLNVIDTIMKRSGGKSVIIVQSDHSSTDYEGCPAIPYLTFKNFSAFYFPDRHYSGLYDTISNINTFPVLFNKYFRTKIPMQKDTATYLRY